MNNIIKIIRIDIRIRYKNRNINDLGTREPPDQQII